MSSITTNPDLIKKEEEPLLARYLVERVCGRAAGAFQDLCTHNAPRDKYFIGSLRPAPFEDELTNKKYTNFVDEFLTKLAPVSFGAEFRLRSENPEALINVRLEWCCYYRVFPTLEEQRNYQRIMSINKNTESLHETKEPTESISVNNVPDAGKKFWDIDEIVEQDLQDSLFMEAPRRVCGSTDVFFPKYRKIRCSADGRVILRRTNNTTTPWQIDLYNIQKATESEFARVHKIILDDPDHLRTNSDHEKRIRIPPEALESETAYSDFKGHLQEDILPQWCWRLDAQPRPIDKVDEIVFFFQATNISRIDTRSWHSEGYFFDIKLNFTFENLEVLPFELELAPQNFRYNRYLWGRGFNCAVVRLPLEEGRYAFSTTNTPIFDQLRYSTHTEPIALFRDLAVDPIPVLKRILDAMKGYNRCWENHRKQYIIKDPSWESKFGAEYECDYQLFQNEINRFEHGCRLIEQDPDVRLAFQLTNQTFVHGGQKKSWRLFQIVFIVSQIPGIYALKSGDQIAMQDRNSVDIIYFPTGGGKTEAYLGVIVFHCFFDRLRGKKAGVTVWTRFPLRLLTIQQTQRVADVIGIAELVRRSHSDPRLSGKDVDGFAVGYFVGQEATPNELTPPRKGEPPDYNWSNANDPDARQRWKRIVKCPGCRTATVRIDFDPDTIRIIHRCTNSSCYFPEGILPVYVIDNEIYRYLPSVVVGTIDKLASLGNQRKLSLVLGKVTGRCVKHGYFNVKCCQKECTDSTLLCPGPPTGISGPTLFIQDELHLLKEGLGTFDSHYETFLQALLQSFGQDIPVKIIASSATIEAFVRQVKHLYGRNARVFPGYGPTLNESFYAQMFEYTQRLYVGVLPHNKTIFNAVLEIIQYYHEEIESLLSLSSADPNPFGGKIKPGTLNWYRLIDPYVTSLIYFSATRELNSINTDLESHVNNELVQAGFSRLRIAELSGSTTTDDVSRILELIETTQIGQNTKTPNVILATSMVSHGVDVDRLNCMIFYGMPKQTAEYIQASSRVGRTHVGIVFNCLKPARERDQSHFSYFEKYHEFLGQLVEPVAINRWSKFSIKRTIPGLFMGILLQRIANSSGEANPNLFYMVNFVKRLISEGRLCADDFLEMLRDAYLINQWQCAGAETFHEEIERRVRMFLDQIIGAGPQIQFVSDSLVPEPMRSLRDVDEQIEIELDANGTAWASRPQL